MRGSEGRAQWALDSGQRSHAQVPAAELTQGMPARNTGERIRRQVPACLRAIENCQGVVGPGDGRQPDAPRRPSSLHLDRGHHGIQKASCCQASDTSREARKPELNVNPHILQILAKVHTENPLWSPPVCWPASIRRWGAGGGRVRPEERCAHRAWHTVNPDTDWCSEEHLAWSNEVKLGSSAEEVQGGDPGSGSALCQEG